MSALSPLSRAAVCRSIYLQAAADHILPPLIRDAADPSPPQRALEAQGPGLSVSFVAAFDPDRPEGPPLRFDIAAARLDGRSIDLSAADRFEMIRAFLLGVREPLVVEAPASGGDWRVALRIAPRFVVAAREPVALAAGLSADEICERLAARLLENTQILFGCRAVGQDVWETRLREELFAERRRPAQELWPVAAPRSLPAPAAALEVTGACAPRPAPSIRRRALAAACALTGLAALGGAIATRTTSDKAPPAAQRAASHATARSAGEGAPPGMRLAALEDPSAAVADPRDLRFALLAPAVTRATFVLSPAGNAPRSASAQPAKSAAPLASRAARPGLDRKASKALRHPRPGPLARMDRSVRQMVRKLGASLRRVKLTALNSPHADGPRLP